MNLTTIWKKRTLLSTLISAVFLVLILNRLTEKSIVKRQVFGSNEAFVTFVTNEQSYIELLDVLLDSIHFFSMRPVIVYSIDFDLKLNRTRHNRTLVERLSSDRCRSSIYSCKLLAMITSQLDYGVQIEIDSVVNYPVDLLFEMIHRWPFDLPLAPKHPNDPENYLFYLHRYKIKHRSTPYVHGTFVWTRRSYPLLEKVLNALESREFLDANVDETAMNIFLWKEETRHVLCRYDPFGPESISRYEHFEKYPKCLPYCDGLYLIFHGQKDVSSSKEIFERLKRLEPDRAFVQTPNGVRWFNESNVTCCHSSAMKPSSIHPLICEYHRQS